MPSKKKKYNARFPPARIKKIMQTDEEIGKVAAAVPVIISRALELFLESLLKKACQVTQSRNAKTMTTSHLKQCIELEQQFDFLKDLVASVPDMQGDGEDNHMDGDKGPRRGRKSGSSGRKNGGMGSKGKDKKLSGTDSEQEDESEDTDSDGEEETPQVPPQASHPPAHFQRWQKCRLKWLKGWEKTTNGVRWGCLRAAPVQEGKRNGTRTNTCAPTPVIGKRQGKTRSHTRPIRLARTESQKEIPWQSSG
uniref:Dr1-associated corepressor n=1 Tax=Bos indicus x Bos taurus TaxID=30522 RepID=A0A4W2G744_BOBOX